MNLIYIDDEQPAIDNFRLTTADFSEIEQLHTFRSGEEALRFVDENVVDVAFLDMEMPGLHGLELARKLKTSNPSIRIVFDRELYDQRLEQLRRWAGEEKLPLTILEGAEVWYTDMTLPMLRSGRIPTIGGTHYVLVEFTPKIPWKRFETALAELFRAGYIPVVAHVERYKNLYRHTAKLLRLHREIDVCLQVNARSVIAPQTLGQWCFLDRLFRVGAIDLVATDAHGRKERVSNMRPAFACLEKRYGRTYAKALTEFSLEQP